MGMFTLRITKEERTGLLARAQNQGFETITDYVRWKLELPKATAANNTEPIPRVEEFDLFSMHSQMTYVLDEIRVVRKSIKAVANRMGVRDDPNVFQSSYENTKGNQVLPEGFRLK